MDKIDPIYDIVALNEDEKRDFVRIGESSYFSGLYIDDNNFLRLSNPDLKTKDIIPYCNCCTHTLNGKLVGSE